MVLTFGVRSAANCFNIEKIGVKGAQDTIQEIIKQQIVSSSLNFSSFARFLEIALNFINS